MQEAFARASRYKKAIEADDDHGAAIRGLTYIDYAMRALLRQKLLHPQAIDLSGKSGKYLVSLARALDLIDEDLCCSLKRFIDLRNKLAHELERELTEPDVDSLIKTFRGDVEEFNREHAHLSGTTGGRLRAAIFALCKAVEFAEMAEMCRQQGEETESELIRARLAELEKALAAQLS
jgi:hypothetical protein